MRRVVLFFLLASACAQNESREVIRQTVAEARTKPRVIIQIRLDSPGYPSETDLQLRQSIEKEIEQQRAGVIVGQESGPGHMDVTIEVDDTVAAIPKIQKILKDAGVLEKTVIRR